MCTTGPALIHQAIARSPSSLFVAEEKTEVFRFYFDVDILLAVGEVENVSEKSFCSTKIWCSQTN